MSFATDVLRETIAKIEVRTTFGPTITLDDPFAPGDPTPSTAGSVLKPSVRFFARDGSQIMSSSPYGDPGITKWPLVVAGLGIVLGWLSYRAFGRRA